MNALQTSSDYDPWTVTATSIEFNRLRRDLARMSGVDEWSIHPATQLRDLLQGDQLDLLWNRLVREKQARQYGNVAAFRRGRWLGGWKVSLALGTTCFVFPPMLLIVLIKIVFSLWVWSNKSLNLYSICPCKTVYELALNQVDYKKEDATDGLWPRDDISAKVRWLIAQHSGWPFGEISEETLIHEL